MSTFIDKSNTFEVLNTTELNEPRFLSLLDKLISESKYLQNSPSQGLIPKEDLASNHVLELLSPYSKENGGPLDVKRISFVEGRGNVIIKYEGSSDRVCSFIGSHLDVVTATGEGWDHDPFKLVIEGDTLYGRGTTDCLGHVALLTDLMLTLAEKRPVLETTVVVIFIANEENSSIVGVGVDELAKSGHMDCIKNGPVYWVDSADSAPCIGTAGVIQWQLNIQGKLFHSGLPHMAINPIEMAFDSVGYIQSKFYSSFPQLPQEIAYNYATCSTMKPTQIETSPGSLNQIPPSCTVRGDIRVCPFYDIADIRVAIESYVQEINNDPTIIENIAQRGPHSKYQLSKENNRQGIATLTWLTEGENGIACTLDSIGLKAICEATKQTLGEVHPFAISGSLPLVRELQEQGFDVQICGFGKSNKYHADNESASLNDFKNAIKILSRVSGVIKLRRTTVRR